MSAELTLIGIGAVGVVAGVVTYLIARRAE